MSNELALNELFAGGAVVSRTADDFKEMERMSQGTDFLRRIQLYSKGPNIDRGLIGGGHFGVPMSKTEITDLSAAIDLLIIERRPKAIDMSDTDNLIITYDSTSEEFRRIEEASATRDSGCCFGPSYLVYERTTGKFYEFFCGSKSARIESSNINAYLPVTPEMIKAGATKEEEVRGPKPCTLRAELVDNGRFTWHVAKPEDCLTPFELLPTLDDLNKEVAKFLTPDENEVEAVKEEDNSKRGKRSR